MLNAPNMLSAVTVGSRMSGLLCSCILLTSISAILSIRYAGTHIHMCAATLSERLCLTGLTSSEGLISPNVCSMRHSPLYMDMISAAGLSSRFMRSTQQPAYLLSLSILFFCTETMFFSLSFHSTAKYVLRACSYSERSSSLSPSLIFSIVAIHIPDAIEGYCTRNRNCLRI